MHMMSRTHKYFSWTNTPTHRWLTVMAVLAVPSVLFGSWESPTKHRTEVYFQVTFDTMLPTCTSQSAICLSLKLILKTKCLIMKFILMSCLLTLFYKFVLALSTSVMYKGSKKVCNYNSFTYYQAWKAINRQMSLKIRYDLWPLPLVS